MSLCCRNLFSVIATTTLLVTCLLPPLVETIDPFRPIIQTTSGRIEGARGYTNGTAYPKEYVSFLGIPYAQPPVGKLRFEKPAPITLPPASGVVTKVQARPPPCPQPDMSFVKEPWFNIYTGREKDSRTEDCLYLNVWLPTGGTEDSGSLLAIMIWIPGGDFSGGSSSIPAYDGSILATENNVAVVSLNYRVGPLGFMSVGKEEGSFPSHVTNSSSSSTTIAGNMGLYDQRLAIKWVYDNALIFGGDPRRITLFGQNAGAVSVESHLASPFSWPYFARVIMQSGTLLSSLTPGPGKSRQSTVELVRKTGCTDMECLKMADVRVLNTLSHFTSLNNYSSIPIPALFGPNLGEEWFWEDPKSIALTKFYKKNVDIMIGSNLREGLYFAGMSPLAQPNPPAKNVLHPDQTGNYDNNLFDVFNRWDEVIKQAIIFQYSDWENEGSSIVEFFDQLLGDYFFTCPISQAAETYWSFGERVYRYYFTHQAVNGLWPSWTQAKHADEIPYVFGEPFRMENNYGIEDILLSQRMMKYWTNFAKTGDPNNDEYGRNTLYYWPKMNPKDKRIMNFNGSQYDLIKDVRKNKCSFWNLYLPYLINATSTRNSQCLSRSQDPSGKGNDGQQFTSEGSKQVLSGGVDMISDTTKTTTGPIRGFVQHVKVNNVTRDINTYLGIPYAQPPVGDLRFKLPQPLSGPLNQTLNATQLPPACYQLVETFFGQNFSGSNTYNPNTALSEDCLYLNVWSPAGSRPDNTPDPKMAVMVWIYGGGFTRGSASLDIYDGSMLAATSDVVVVNFNYRLGPLGFLFLHDEVDQGAAGNMGLYDQRLALRWVSENIAGFGGDPRKITLFGESAGAVSIDMHIQSAASWPYFTRAILESGTVSNFFTILSKEKALEYASDLVAGLGCGNLSAYANTPAQTNATTNAAILECLRGAPVQNITALGSIVTKFLALRYTPVNDGRWFGSYPLKALTQGKFKRDVSILMGSNSNEGSYFMFYGFPQLFLPLNRTLNLTLSDYTAAMPAIFFALNSTQTDLVTSYYTDWFGTDNQFNLVEAFEKTISDFFITCDINRAADLYAEYGTGSVFKYYFEHTSSASPWPKWTGSRHTDEISYVMGQPVKGQGNDVIDDVTMSTIIMRYWTNFAKTGNPNTDSTGVNVETLWPRYTTNAKLCLTLDTNSLAIVRGPRLEQCDFRETFFPELFSTYSGDMRKEEIFDLNHLSSRQRENGKYYPVPPNQNLMGSSNFASDPSQNKEENSPINKIETHISPPNNYGPFNVKLFYYLFGKN